MGEASPLIRTRCAVVVTLPPSQSLLVARQNNAPFWVLPGGTLEVGETLAQCATRELLEECDLSVALTQLVALGEWLDPAKGKHVIDAVFTADYTSGPTQWQGELPENLNELRTVTLSEFEVLPFKPDWLKPLIVEAWASGWQHWPSPVYRITPPQPSP